MSLPFRNVWNKISMLVEKWTELYSESYKNVEMETGI